MNKTPATDIRTGIPSGLDYFGNDRQSRGRKLTGSLDGELVMDELVMNLHDASISYSRFHSLEARTDPAWICCLAPDHPASHPVIG